MRARQHCVGGRGARPHSPLHGLVAFRGDVPFATHTYTYTHTTHTHTVGAKNGVALASKWQRFERQLRLPFVFPEGTNIRIYLRVMYVMYR